MAKTEDLEKALKLFVECIEAAGGIRHDADGLSCPVGDEEWIDLADAYETACAALGREPVVVEADEDTDIN